MFIHQESMDCEDFTVAIVESVGFVISENSEQIVLAGDIVDDDVRRVIVIPKENIEVLKLRRRTKKNRIRE
jgi:hypothetical protein